MYFAVWNLTESWTDLIRSAGRILGKCYPQKQFITKVRPEVWYGSKTLEVRVTDEGYNFDHKISYQQLLIFINGIVPKNFMSKKITRPCLW